MATWTSEDVYGLDTIKLPDGCRPLEAIIAVKCLTDEGETVHLHRYSRTVATPEALGMAHALVIMLTEEIKAGYTHCDCEPYEDPDS
jgi:hypothetical protein